VPARRTSSEPAVTSPSFDRALRYLSAVFHVFFNESIGSVREIAGALLEFQIAHRRISVNGADA
jgi:hypothetical protein